MPEFISLSEASNVHIDLKDIGKSTGFLGLGRKVYLVYDAEKGQWGVKRLNLGQRILRTVFGLYKDTTKNSVAESLAQSAIKNLLTAQQNSQLNQRINDIWKIQLSENDEVPLKKGFSKISSSKSQVTIPTYNAASNKFTNVDPQSLERIQAYTKALQAENGKNIQAVALFGDWQKMEYNVDSPDVKESKPFKLLEKMATEIPELGNFAFFNVRGNGECGYRTIIDGILHADCIAKDNIDGLKLSIEGAYQQLAPHWEKLPFENDTEKARFEESKNEVIVQLDRMKTMNQEERMSLLQEEKPFLAPFLSLIRCLSVSQTLELMSDNLQERVLTNEKESAQNLDSFGFTETEREKLSYAVNNYSASDLLGSLPLADKPQNPEKNKLKKDFQDLAKHARNLNSGLFFNLLMLARDKYELSNKQTIVTAFVFEKGDLDGGTGSDEAFLRLKAFGDADSPRPLWALGSDFVAVGYALNKNICCIYKEQFKEDYAIQTTFQNRPADFYGLNMTGQVHYNVLVPL